MASKKREKEPQDLEEAVDYLIAELSEEDHERISVTTKDEFMVTAHFGLGMWIRNNLGVWEGGALAKDLKENHGCFMADDMSGVVLEALWNKVQRLGED